MRYAAWPDARHVHLGFKSTDIAATRGFKWTEPDADHDLFDDGSIVILKTPGHTPGECSLKVRLKNETVMLTGDTLHLRIQLKTLQGTGGDYDRSRRRIRSSAWSMLPRLKTPGSGSTTTPTIGPSTRTRSNNGRLFIN